MAKVVINPEGDFPKRPAQPSMSAPLAKTNEEGEEKPGVFNRIVRIFFARDIDEVWDYLVKNIVRPSFEDVIISMISNGAEMLFRRNKTGGGYTPQRYSREPVQRYQQTFVQPDTRYSYQRRQVQPIGMEKRRLVDFRFNTEEEARYIIDQLETLCEQFSWASVDDYYQLIGVTGNHVDQKWGWRTMGNVRIFHDNAGYGIDFPEVIPKSSN